MTVTIGSARIDEHGNATGGAAGDQTGREVMQQNFYVHSKGWNVIRPKLIEDADKIGDKMIAACNNKNIGYDQNNRLGVIENGISSKVTTECDCSSLVRACVKEATGKDPGNFTTYNEVDVLEKTGLFLPSFSYNSTTKLYKGDILCTKSKGHTVIVTKSSNIRKYETSDSDKVTNSDNKESVSSSNKINILGGITMPEISRGSKGKVVRIWQSMLGFTGSDIDGSFGPYTEKKTKEFQKKVFPKDKKEWDGIVGVKTWTKGFESL